MLQMNFLSPEKNIKFLKLYHTSSKLLIPLGIFSYGLHELNYKKTALTLDIFNITNFTYHSYVSTSCIISDYIKIRQIEPIIRSSSAITHSLACIGFVNIIYKYNKN